MGILGQAHRVLPHLFCFLAMKSNLHRYKQIDVLGLVLYTKKNPAMYMVDKHLDVSARHDLFALTVALC